MATLSEERICDLLAPYIPEDTTLAPRIASMLPQLSTYLDLLLRWNERTNLTAIREPAEIVQRHFGESIFAAGEVARAGGAQAQILDFGSGAGFPGIPMQLCLPKSAVCLGESQGKKAAFLREVVRALRLATEVWAGRVEDMPSSRVFDVVTLRAVDRMAVAMSVASPRVNTGGQMMVLGGDRFEPPAGWGVSSLQRMPRSSGEFVYTFKRL